MGKYKHSLFVKKKSKGIVVVLIYVDDIVIIGENLQEIETLKKYLHKKFDIKDLGRLRYFLGIEVASFIKCLFLP